MKSWLSDKLPLSFRGQALLFLVPLIVIMSLVYTAVSISTERKILRNELIKRGEVIAAITARNAEIPILSENHAQLKASADAVMQIKDIIFVTLLDKKLEPLLHAGDKHPEHTNLPDGKDLRPRFYEHDESFEFVAPVMMAKLQEDHLLFEGEASAATEKIHIGWVRLGLSKSVMNKSLQALLLQGIILAALFSIAGILLAYLLIAIATRPLQALIKAVNELRQGEYIELPAAPRGEIGKLTNEFNRMSRAIREREEALEQNVDELEMQIEAREAVEAELRNHRDHLEELVDKRTEQLQSAKEQAEEASRAKSDFLSSMSHELRTPLNAILGYTQILKRKDNITSPQLQQLDIMQSSGEHLLTLINDILDVGKIEARKMEIDSGDFDLPALLRQVVAITKLQAEEKELRFNYEIATELPRYVRGDERKLRQILLNLLSNAVKYTRHGTVLCKVSYNMESGAFCCEVTDTGIGIPTDKFDAVFEPFTQLQNSSQPRIGTGLGLNITRQLLMLMGGEISLDSTLGKGSRFIIQLPLPTVADADTALQAAPQHVTGYDGKRRRILIVDDVIGNRSMLVSLLEPLGFNLDTAANGLEAMQMAEASPPDMIIMDLVMPEMDGLEAVKRLRAIPALADTKIIGASATVTESYNKNLFAESCDAFLEKPVKIDLLLGEVGELLELSWEYGVALEGGVSAVKKEEKEIVIPAPERLHELYELARFGDIQKITAWCLELQNNNNSYTGFAAQVLEFASGFRIKGIISLIEQQLGENR